MDNKVFEILIALYFIFAFIGGILKKKKKEREKAARRAIVPASDSVSRDEIKAKRNRDTEEMLNKLLGVQIKQPPDDTDFEEEITEKFIQPENAEELPTWDPEDEFKEEEDFEGISPEKINDPLAEKYRPKTSSSEFREPTLLDEVNFGNSSYRIITQSSYSRNLIKKLKNPATLKEAILLAEIIGKPKALRRNG